MTNLRLLMIASLRPSFKGVGNPPGPDSGNKATFSMRDFDIKNVFLKVASLIQ